MTGNLHVDTDTLRADAARLESLPMNPVATQVLPLCGLPAAQHVAAALNANAEDLHSCQAKLSQLRDANAAALRQAAAVYDAADASAAGGLQAAGSRFDGGGGGGGGVPLPAMPAAIPAPNLPIGLGVGAKVGAALGGLADNGFGTVPDTQAAISAPDQGGSLSAAIAIWQAQGATLQASAAGIPTSPTGWEGDAADAAYAGLKQLQTATHGMASAWQRLAEQGSTLLPNHASLTADHTEVFNSYMQLMAARAQYAAMGNAEAVMQVDMALAQAQQQSEEIRTDYARAAATETVHPPEVPRGPGSSGTPIQARTKNEPAPQPSVPRSSTPAQDNAAQPGSSAAPSGNPGAGRPPASAAPQQPAAASTAPQSAAQPASEAASQAAQKAAGGAPSGGSGGSPGGGKPPGGMPQMPGGMPKMPGGMPGGDKAGAGKGFAPKPFSPPVRPAGAGAGGAGKGLGAGGAGKGGGGAGKGGGAGGGGMGARPLSPAVTASGVAPAAAGEGAGAAAPAGRGSGGGGAGGGMPMGGHGAGHGQGKERKRRPELTSDEAIYTEDRAWTEGVVGHRRREVRPNEPEGGQ